MQPHQELLIWRGCDGKDHAADVAVHVGFPSFECLAVAAQGEAWGAVAEMVVGFPALACVIAGPEDADRIRKAEVWLFPINFDFVVTHEFNHIRGYSHPRMLPLLQRSGC
jgi:hypothetical protein